VKGFGAAHEAVGKLGRNKHPADRIACGLAYAHLMRSCRGMSLPAHWRGPEENSQSPAKQLPQYDEKDQFHHIFKQASHNMSDDPIAPRDALILLAGRSVT